MDSKGNPKRPSRRPRKRAAPRGRQAMKEGGRFVIKLFEEQLAAGKIIDIPTFVSTVLESTKSIDPAKAFEQILKDQTSSEEYRSFAVAGLRALAERGKLSSTHASVLLQATQRQALRFGNDELEKSIRVIARSPTTAPILLDFATHLLISNQGIPDRRWLAFTAVSAVLQNATAAIPDLLRNKLEQEAALEEDQVTKKHLEDFVRDNF